MQPRLERYLEAAQAEGITFDWVLLLAGVNDVGGYKDGDKIFEGLCNTYKVCGLGGGASKHKQCCCWQFSRVTLSTKRCICGPRAVLQHSCAVLCCAD